MSPYLTEYNLGNKIALSVSIIEGTDFVGFLRVTLECGEKQVPYYIKPIKISANRLLEEKIPELTTTKYLMGKCRIILNLIASEGKIIEEKIIDNIIITDEMRMNVEKLGKYLPGEKITLTGTLKDISNNNPENLTISMEFNGVVENIPVKNGIFRHELTIPAKISYGVHYITLSGIDSHDNKANAQVMLNLLQKPTSILIIPGKYQFLPNEEIEILVKLIDQADELINASINLAIKNPKGNLIFSEKVLSNSIVKYNLEQYAMPGIYTINSGTHDISIDKLINVSKVERLDVSLVGNLLSIKNIGNIPYSSDSNLVVKSDTNVFVINKKLNLYPGEVRDIDMSKEVPSDNYDVRLESADKDYSVSYNLIDTNATIIENVSIEDNRPLYRKITQGLGFTSNTNIREKLRAPFYLLVILVLIILIVIYIHKKFFMEHRLLEKEQFPKSSANLNKMLDKTLSKKK